jgi:fumarate reductase subunit D
MTRLRIPRWNLAHTAPLRWMLFGAGGVIAAVVLPGWVLIVGVAGPLDVIDLRVLSLTLGPLSVLGLRCVMHLGAFLLLMHAVHRIYYLIHDLQIPRPRWVFYGLYGLGVSYAVFAVVDLMGWWAPLLG